MSMCGTSIMENYNWPNFGELAWKMLRLFYVLEERIWPESLGDISVWKGTEYVSKLGYLVSYSSTHLLAQHGHNFGSVFSTRNIIFWTYKSNAVVESYLVFYDYVFVILQKDKAQHDKMECWLEGRY